MALSIVFLLNSLCILLYISNGLPEEQIFFDIMDSTTASNWTYGGDVYIPSYASQCLQMSECFELNQGGWAERAFSTKGYHSVYFKLMLDGLSSGTVDIKIYDDNILVSDIGKSFSTSEGRKNVKPPQSQTYDWDDIDVFVIRFAMEESATVFMDSLEIIGIPITIVPTVYSTIPTVTPSVIPTVYPSVLPTSDPTSYPTFNPSFHPSFNPTIIPTTIPTRMPTVYPTSIPTVSPNIFITMEPTINPSINPTTIPTIVPSAQPTIDNAQDVDNESTMSTINDAAPNGKQSHDAIFSDRYLLTHWYYLVAILAIIFCLLCTVAIYCGVCRNKKMLRHIEKERIEQETMIKPNGATHMQIELQTMDIEHEEPISVPNTHVTAHSPSPSPQPIFPMATTPNGLSVIENSNIEQQNVHNQSLMQPNTGEVHMNIHEQGDKKSHLDNYDNDNEDDDAIYGSGTDSQNEMEDVIETKGQTLGGMTAGANGVNVPEDTDTDEGSENVDISDDNIQRLEIAQNENINYTPQ